jgi:hypothetical protein
MKTVRALILITVITLINSCGTGQRVINSWGNANADRSKEYNKVFIIALTQNEPARNIIETDLSRAIKDLGKETVLSSNVFPGTFTKGTAPTEEAVINKVKELNCDLVFTVSLLDSKTETRYVPGTVSYAPYPAYGYYRGFGFYYDHWAPTVYSPGYYTTDKVYYVEGNLFDADTEGILWSVQSETYNPSNIKEFSANYSKLIINQAEKDGLIK